MSARKVQFCSGSNILNGFDNHDGDVNINERLPFGDGSMEFVFIEHGLEHTDCACGLKFLDEAYRILQPGGVIRICVPTLKLITDRNHARSLCLGHGHQMLYCMETLHQMLWCAGFSDIRETGRKDTDGHWRVIGEPLDTQETLRMEATK